MKKHLRKAIVQMGQMNYWYFLWFILAVSDGSKMGHWLAAVMFFCWLAGVVGLAFIYKHLER